MILFKQAQPLVKFLGGNRKTSRKIGFVPTMGALHAGHLSLISKAKVTCDITVCSIFVNPTQFNDKKDFQKYPVTIEQDIFLLEQSGCDVLFYPSVDEMYPEGIGAVGTYPLGEIETVLEGQYRPGHFQGVCRVVHKLLDIIAPDQLFLGRKDYQQCMVIKKLIDILGYDIVLTIGETHREASGLAMSSRNLRLTNEQKEQATSIYQTLLYIKENYTTLSIPELQRQAEEKLIDKGFDQVDYVRIVDADTLMPVSNHRSKAVALIAAFIGGIRLIDNMLLN